MKFSGHMKFDMKRAPHKPLQITKLMFWTFPLLSHSMKTKTVKVGFKSFKEPTLLISPHQSYRDFGNLQKGMFPLAPVYVCAIEEFSRAEPLFRMTGTIAKIRWTKDVGLILKMRRAINEFKYSIILYPEAKWSPCGITEPFSDKLGKTAKILNCRVIVLQPFGNYLYNPFWQYGKYKNKKLASRVVYNLVCTKEESQTLSAEEIQARIEKYMEYDEYKYQLENHIEIKSDYHLQDVERIIYKCPDCHSLGSWSSNGNTMTCKKCGLTYRMDDFGELHLENGRTKTRILSDLYRWEREETKKEVYDETYHFEDDCELFYYVNGRTGFKRLGQCHFIHDKTGLTFNGILDNGESIYIHKNPIEQESLRIEPKWKGKWPGFKITTIDNIFLLLPLNKKDALFKIMHAVEAQYVKAKQEISNHNKSNLN